MVKSMVLLKRKPGLSVEEFRRHYETVHAPMAVELFPMMKRYVRNYVTGVPFATSTGEPEFDCITEECFDDAEGFRAWRDIALGEAGRALRDDEKKFLDRTKIVYVVVEEVASR